MAAPPFVDLAKLDPTRLQVTREQIYQHLPQRYEFMQLDGIVTIDLETNVAVGLRLVREDEFWVKGHIPGRPLLPGVLMLESAAQMAAYMSHVFQPDNRFLGFGGLDNVKFRGTVTPPATMFITLKLVEARSRRTVCDSQGWVDNRLIFEGRFTGMPV
ncbi:MAG: beta-hydroxyacyl-ACP dehydratase [Phycisphaerae bacterium]|nr:beta-hydroxyacyl-ACP dehydratase [Phycisphaerae bacterium]